MFSDIFWNYLAMPLIFGVFIFWLASWIWVFVKADQALHRVIDPAPRAATPEELAAAKASNAKMRAKFMAEAANHHH